MDESLVVKADLLAELFIVIAGNTNESPVEQEADLIDTMKRQ